MHRHGIFLYIDIEHAVCDGRKQNLLALFGLDGIYIISTRLDDIGELSKLLADRSKNARRRRKTC